MDLETAATARPAPTFELPSRWVGILPDGTELTLDTRVAFVHQGLLYRYEREGRQIYSAAYSIAPEQGGTGRFTLTLVSRTRYTGVL